MIESDQTAAGIDHNATDPRAVTSHPLGERIDDDVCTVIYGPHEIGRGKSGIHQKGKAVLLGHLADGFDIGKDAGSARRVETGEAEYYRCLRFSHGSQFIPEFSVRKRLFIVVESIIRG